MSDDKGCAVEAGALVTISARDLAAIVRRAEEGTCLARSLRQQLAALEAELEDERSVIGLRTEAQRKAEMERDRVIGRAQQTEHERDLVRGLNEALRRREAELVERAEKAERERDAAVAHHGELVDAMRDAIARAEKAERERDLCSAQISMISSEIHGDPKIRSQDQSDPRWTPALEAAGALRSSVIDARRDRDAAIARAEQAERDRDETSGAWDDMRRQRDAAIERAEAIEARAVAQADHDCAERVVLMERAECAERERDEAIARAEKAVRSRLAGRAEADRWVLRARVLESRLAQIRRALDGGDDDQG